MNTAPRPGQPGQGVPQPGAVQAGQQRIQLLRPETIEKISWLPQEEKLKYANGLRQLWQSLESHPKDSPEFASTHQKILQISRSLLAKNAQIQQQRRQQQAQIAQQANATASNANANGAAAPVARPAVPGMAATGGNTTETAAGNTAAAAAASGGNAASAQAPQVPLVIPEHIRKHLEEIRLQAPVNIIAKGEVESKRFLENLKKAYASALVRMEGAKAQMNRIDAIIKQREGSGNHLAPDERRAFQARKDAEQKKHDDARKVVEQIRRQQTQLVAQKGQNGAMAGSQPQGGASATPVPVPTLGTAATAAATAGSGVGGTQGPKPGQGAAATVNAAVGEAGKTARTSMAAARHVAGQGLPGAGIAATTQSQPRVTKIEPPHPPPVNTQIASAPHAGPPSGTPTQNSARVQTPATASAFPNSAAPATPAGQPRHSFTSAISMASQSQSSAGASAPSGTPNQGPNMTPSSNPGVIGAAPQQAQAQAHAHPSHQTAGGTLPPKMPISKQLPEQATRPPAPVAVHQSRPTLSGGTGTPAGALGQPVNPKVPAYQHQDEGEHVLSKKRLDDLVRQVCGGTAEGQPTNLLTAEVEENILLLVDNMVDNTLNIACRFAKERGSKVLEIRDIQLVLERVYNIRVPGYSSDELRTVRRVQPNSAWISKMSAVQASKVMPGKGD